jgi:hypothetical protein
LGVMELDSNSSQRVGDDGDDGTLTSGASYLSSGRVIAQDAVALGGARALVFERLNTISRKLADWKKVRVGGEQEGDGDNRGSMSSDHEHSQVGHKRAPQPHVADDRSDKDDRSDSSHDAEHCNSSSDDESVDGVVSGDSDDE